MKPFVSGALEGVRVLDLGHADRRAVLRRTARRAGRGGHQDRTAARRRLHARDRSVRRRLLAVLGGRGPRPQERDARPAHARGPGRLPPARGDRRRRRRELPARHARAVEHRPDRLAERLVTVRISMFGQDGPYSARPGLDRVGIGYGGLLHLTGYPDRPPVRVGVTISDYLTGVFAAHAAVAALYARDARGGRRRGDRRRAVRRRCCASSSGRCPRTTGSARSAAAKATGSRTRRRSTTTPPPTASTCASSPAPTPTSAGSARRWTGSTCSTTRGSRGSPIAPRTATRSTASSPTGPRRSTRARSRNAASRTTCRSRPRTRRPTSSPTRISRPATTSSPSTIPSSARSASRRRIPRHVGETRSRPRARPGSASTPTRCCRRCCDLSTAEIDALRGEGRRVSARRRSTTGCSRSAADGSIALIGGYSPTSGKYHFPLLDTCPYSGATDVRAGRAVARRDAVGLDRGHRRAARLQRPGAVRVRRRRARRTSSCASSRGSRESDPAQLEFGQPMTLVADELPDGVVTWAFA